MQIPGRGMWASRATTMRSSACSQRTRARRHVHRQRRFPRPEVADSQARSKQAADSRGAPPLPVRPGPCGQGRPHTIQRQPRAGNTTASQSHLKVQAVKAFASRSLGALHELRAGGQQPIGRPRGLPRKKQRPLLQRPEPRSGEDERTGADERQLIIGSEEGFFVLAGGVAGAPRQVADGVVSHAPMRPLARISLHQRLLACSADPESREDLTRSLSWEMPCFDVV
jgi:hypothetical protein